MQVTDAVVLESVEPVYGIEQWIEFAGRLHPVVLHMPIGLFAALALLEGITLFSRATIPARRALSVAFALSAVVAAATGWFLGTRGGYSGSLYDEHRGLGIAAAIAAVVLVTLDLVGRTGFAALVRRSALVGCGALLLFAGHQGGMLTHGRTHLSAVAPPALAPYLGEAAPERKRRPRSAASFVAPAVETEPRSEDESPPSEEAASDVALVVEAFRERCFECHNDEKSKGDLRLDVVAGWTDTVDLEAPEDSELLFRVMLPGDDVDAMPPKGERLDASVIDALRRWIDAGASEEELGEELGVLADVERQADLDLEGVRTRAKARIVPIAADLGVPAAEARLDVSWRFADETPTPDEVAALAFVADRLVALDLARPDVGDASLRALPALPSLERIHLEGSAVTDAGLASLVEQAPHLRYVNVHSTGLTDGALESLIDLERLERVVLYGTAVSDRAVQAFATARPDVHATADVGFPQGFARGAARARRVLVSDPVTGELRLYEEVAIGSRELVWERAIESPDGTSPRVIGTFESGRTLVALGPALLELDLSGDVVAEVHLGELGEGPFDAVPLDAVPLALGAWAVRSGGGDAVACVDPDGSIRWRRNAGDLGLEDLERFTRLQALAEDRVLVGTASPSLLAVEFDAEGQVLWRFARGEHTSSAAGIRVIDPARARSSR